MSGSVQGDGVVVIVVLLTYQSLAHEEDRTNSTLCRKGLLSEGARTGRGSWENKTYRCRGGRVPLHSNPEPSCFTD